MHAQYPQADAGSDCLHGITSAVCVNASHTPCMPGAYDWLISIGTRPWGICNMSITLVRLILYVHDVAAIKAFYQTHFALPVSEEIADEWVVLAAGGIELALHRVGQAYRQRPSTHAPAPVADATHATTKLVFAMTSDLVAHRAQLQHAGVQVGELKRYPGFAYQMYDGRDPEGNVFQVMRLD